MNDLARIDLATAPLPTNCEAAVMDGDLFPLLKEREGRIERAERDGYLVRGRELAAIRDGKLYRERYQTFEAYCETRWEMTIRRAEQLMAAAEFGEKANNCSLPIPAREGHIRPLLTGKLDGDDRLAVWQEVLDAAGGQPRNVKAADVANAVAARMPPSLSRVSGDADDAVDDEATVDSDDPPSVTALTERGRMERRPSKPPVVNSRPAVPRSAALSRDTEVGVVTRWVRRKPADAAHDIACVLGDDPGIRAMSDNKRLALLQEYISAFGFGPIDLFGLLLGLQADDDLNGSAIDAVVEDAE